MDSEIKIQACKTPNPHSLQFLVNQPIASSEAMFTALAQTSESPLAKKIIGFPWVSSVFIGKNFVTINKEAWLEWDSLIAPLISLIQEHIESKEPCLLPSKPAPSSLKKKNNSTKLHPLDEKQNKNDQKIISKIVHILDEKIQPAVKMDGGFIRFSRFEQGKVFIEMQGACSGCPSATWTLKNGIESLLKQEIPEVTEVIPIES